MIKKNIFKREEVEEEKINVKNFSKKVIGVVNPHLAFELAVHISKYTKLKVCLIDGDNINPIIAEIAGKDFSEDNLERAINCNGSGFEIEKMYSTEISGVHLFNGTNTSLKCEEYDTNLIELLIFKLREVFDIVIISLADNIYNGIYLKTLSLGGGILYGIEGYAEEIYKFNRRMQYLKSKTDIDLQQHQFVAFDFSNDHLSKAQVKELLGEQYLGCIKASPNRNKGKNNLFKSYSLEKKVTADYHKLAQKIGIETKGGKRWT